MTTLITDTNDFTVESASDFLKARLFLGLSRVHFGKLLGYRGKHIHEQIKNMEDGKKAIMPAQIRMVEAFICDDYRSPDWDDPEELEVIEPEKKET